MTSANQPPPPSGPAPGLAPAGPKRQQRGIRLPQLLLSLLVVAIFALLAVWWQASTTSRTAVVALAVDVEQGQAIRAEHLTEIFVSTDVPARLVDARESADFIGARPVTDLQAGTMLSRQLFVVGAELDEGQAFVGLVLGPTRAPRGIVTGDRVQILAPTNEGPVDIISPDARVEAANYDANGTLTVLLRLGLTDGQRAQTRSNQVVLIEVENAGTPSWEVEAPS